MNFLQRLPQRLPQRFSRLNRRSTLITIALVAWLLSGIFSSVILSASRCVASESTEADQPPRVLPEVLLSSQSNATTTPATASPATLVTPGIDWKVMGVIAAAFSAVVLLRILSKRRDQTLPPDVFDVLGSGTLGGQHMVRIVRFGPKTLLVSVSNSGCQTLSELTDPEATRCIAAACRGLHPRLRPAEFRATSAGREAVARSEVTAAVSAASPATATGMRAAGQEAA